MQLPASLRAQIDQLLDGVSTQDLAHHYQALSDRYRRQNDAASLQIQNKMEALAYLVSRFPATYGAISDVLNRLCDVWPDFAPQTIADLGAGPGTATLAALSAWPETVTAVTAIEPNPHLAELARHLISETEISLTLQPLPLQATPDIPSADLILLSYVLNELPVTDIPTQVEKIWEKTGSTLVLIEPGTPLGFQTVLQARDTLLKLNAHIAAPCPHSLACPLRESDRWCHFSVRVDRSSLHRRVKGDATLSYEDEKFSYVVATRHPVPRPEARVIGHPHGTKIIELELCDHSGHATFRTFSKRDPIYKRIKKLKWGDEII